MSEAGASWACDMKIPFETILDFHAHGCPTGHGVLLLTLVEEGSGNVDEDSAELNTFRLPTAGDPPIGPCNAQGATS
jgi:hypothetical protein